MSCCHLKSFDLNVACTCEYQLKVIFFYNVKVNFLLLYFKLSQDTLTLSAM